jgi:hypothetical protein
MLEMLKKISKSDPSQIKMKKNKITFFQ